ncbi:Hydrolase (HAD superfamily) [Minicystis rosea]|nr:Hydrolase (HAD superfamily) [Minicystis rosea]
MQYKLLAVDVDGTLLRRDGVVDPQDSAAIARLRAQGVPVTIVTGRLYSGTRPVAASLGLGGPIACVDGSHIVDVGDDRALYASPITGTDALLLRDVLARHHIARFLFAEDTIIHDAEGEPFAGYVRTWSPNVDVVARVTDHPSWEHERGVMAVVAVGAEHDVLGAAAELSACLDRSTRVITFPVGRGKGYAMVVRAAGPTKGTAITWLAAHHGCTTEEVVVVGDWINDVPMFQTAGRSFVMGQAPDDVKATATDHLEADSFAGGGIAEAIRRAWGL